MKPNDQINNYTLLCECGKGSFGKVFLAQRDDGKYVAFKVVSLLGDAGERELQAIESYSKCPLCESLLEIFDFVIPNFSHIFVKVILLNFFIYNKFSSTSLFILFLLSIFYYTTIIHLKYTLLRTILKSKNTHIL